MPRRLLLVGLLGCGEPAAPGKPPETPPGPPPPASAPVPPGSPAQRQLDAQLVALGDDVVTVVGAEGEVTFRARPEALRPPRPPVGKTIRLALDDRGAAPLVTAILPHTGLPIAWGTVSALDDASLRLTGPVGETTYQRNRWSDLPAGLAVGDYVSVKSYDAGGRSAILNVRRFPGRVEAYGTLTDVGPEGFTLATLGGPRAFPGPASLAVGTPVLVHHRRGLDGAPEAVQVEPAAEPHLFIGKLSSALPGRLLLVDAWGATLGVVEVAYAEPLPADVVPGDLVEVSWRITDGRPTADTVVERPLSQVFFGRIDAITDTEIRMTTLQRQAKVLRRTSETWLPHPIAVGDMADVMWSSDADGGPFVAEAVVKE